MIQEPANMNMNPSDTDDNVVQPFQLDVSGLRGRSVRLGSVLEEILAPHAYPPPVAQLVAETMLLALLLSSMLKFDGIFTLQIKGDGPVSLLVADVTSDGHVRACASYDTERLAFALADKADGELRSPVERFIGEGYCAFTVDQDRAGHGMPERYQGVVDVRGESLMACVQYYFTQSEQIATAITMAVGRVEGQWRAGGILLQIMPETGGDLEKRPKGNTEEDDWRRAMILMGSCTEEELLAPDLHSNILLARLFLQEGVRVFSQIPVIKKCRCNVERVENILNHISVEDLTGYALDGNIIMKCEFCSHEYVFGLAEIIEEREAE